MPATQGVRTEYFHRFAFLLVPIQETGNMPLAFQPWSSGIIPVEMIDENGFATIPAIHYMVNRAGILNSELARVLESIFLTY